MMATDNIIDVSEADFEYQVLAYSQQAPVVVDFWASWCIPCRTLGPQLERLAQQAQGAFRLAKVDVDSNPKLAQQYNVNSIPSVKAFQNGRVVAEFVGVQPEPRLRDFIRNLVPSASDLALEKAQSLIATGNWEDAAQSFRQVLEKWRDNSSAQLGLMKCLLVLGESGEALQLIRAFPASREYSAAQTLLPLAESLDQFKGNGFQSDDALDAAFHRALKLVSHRNIPAAMDGLLDILREDKRYRDGLARQVLLGIFEILGDNNPLARQYRQELASVLF